MLPIVIFFVSLLLFSVYLYATKDTNNGNPFILILLILILVFGPFIPLVIDQENPKIIKSKIACRTLKNHSYSWRPYRGPIEYEEVTFAKIDNYIIMISGRLPINKEIEVYRITYRFLYQKDKTYYISCDDYDRLHP